MKVIEKVKTLFSPDKKNVFEEDVVHAVLTELEKRKEERRPFELQWRLNANFMAGKQLCEINPYSMQIEEMLPAYDYEERGVYNKIAPLMETRLANLKTVSFAMSVKPRTDEADDYDKAEVASKLLRYASLQGNFDHKKNMLMQWAELTGSAFLLSFWDEQKGPALAVDEEGCPSVREGEIGFTLLSPYEVYPEHLYRQGMDEQGSFIIEQVMSAKEIYDLYGIETDGREIDTVVLTPVSSLPEDYSLRMGDTKLRASEKVITYMEKPSVKHPEGVMALIAAGRLVYYDRLPFSRIPLTIFRAKEAAGQFYGTSVIEELIPLQRAYNGCKNKIHDYITTLAANSFLVEEGSVDVEAMEENGTAPGTPVVYKKGYSAPVPLRHESMPGEIYVECEQLARDMEYTAGVSQLMVVGSMSAGITSGRAINSLREIDSTRMALAADNMRAGAIETAKIWLEIYKEHASGSMVLSVAGSNDFGSVLTWCADDINSYDVYFDTENELKYSPERQKEAFLSAYNMGLFTDENGRIPERFKLRAAELMRIGEYGTLMNETELQMKRAKRENSLLLTGKPPEIGEFDNDDVHIEEHRRFALQLRFDALRTKRPDLAQAFSDHIHAHMERSGQRAESENSKGNQEISAPQDKL
ncbi:MAG: hypothetical protein HFE78_00705 [Clostridiales bacterium]|nr:hypothetical protein [Clostridiales bacterium]